MVTQRIHNAINGTVHYTMRGGAEASTQTLSMCDVCHPGAMSELNFLPYVQQALQTTKHIELTKKIW